MDKDAEKQQRENELATLESYLDHPVSKEILRSNNEECEALLTAVLRTEIVDLQTFFAHFRSLGKLEGLRQARLDMTAKRDELKEIIQSL